MQNSASRGCKVPGLEDRSHFDASLVAKSFGRRFAKGASNSTELPLSPSRRHEAEVRKFSYGLYEGHGGVTVAAESRLPRNCGGALQQCPGTAKQWRHGSGGGTVATELRRRALTGSRNCEAVESRFRRRHGCNGTAEAHSHRVQELRISGVTVAPEGAHASKTPGGSPSGEVNRDQMKETWLTTGHFN